MKNVFLGSLVMILSQSIFAQNVSFGPSVGIGHSWLSGVQQVKFKPGVNIAGALVYSFNPHWGIGGDIRVSLLEGVKTEAVSGQPSSLNATYLRMPFKLFHFFGKYGDRIRPKIYIGPSLGVLLGGNTKAYQEPDGEVKDVVEPFDFGIVAGAGLNFRIKTATWLTVDLAYNNGLVDALKAPGYNANRNISLNVGVAFPLGTIKQ